MKEFETESVQHTDFEKNTLAKKAFFGNKINNNLINDIYNGFIPAKRDIIQKLLKYILENKDNCGNSDLKIMWNNFLFLLAIRVQFSYGDNAYYKKYLEIANIYNNNDIILNNVSREYTASINDKQLYNVLLPIFNYQ